MNDVLITAGAEEDFNEEQHDPDRSALTQNA